MRCPSLAETLFLIDKVTASILLPAAFVFFHAERFFFAVADDLNAIGADSGRNQSALHGRGPLIAQCQVVFGRAAGIAVSLNRKVNVGMLVEELSVRLDGGLLIGAKVRFVVIEIDVLDGLAEEILLRSGWRRSSCCRGRRSDGEARRGVLGSAGTFGSEMIRGGIGGINLLRSAGLNRANAVD